MLIICLTTNLFLYHHVVVAGGLHAFEVWSCPTKPKVTYLEFPIARLRLYLFTKHAWGPTQVMGYEYNDDDDIRFDVVAPIIHLNTLIYDTQISCNTEIQHSHFNDF